ncbi:hypothetical protein D8B46_05145 [Candidatus Gracilibacteria bacterium]|nr:hypothetical protein [Candidatus Gracilibacteria bacterium]RKW22588.1 MAG: hypothetical protein D8B46_05145 [Candidatus Gracilibacteria bacterium]
MKIINSLQVVFENIEFSDEIQENIIILEEKLQKNPDLEFDISEKEIIVFNKNFFNNETISFKDYIEVGAILKDFLIENNIANLQNYKTFFKIKKLEIPENSSEIDLDKFIAKVDANDKKLLEVDEFLKKLGK